jgi:hypothetical protein
MLGVFLQACQHTEVAVSFVLMCAFRLLLLSFYCAPAGAPDG